MRDLGPPYEIVALAAHSNTSLLEEQIREWRPNKVCVYDAEAAKSLKSKGLGVSISTGEEGLIELASDSGADAILVATTGIAALRPTLSALSLGKRVLIANKEIVVSAGPLIMQEAKRSGGMIIPIDSEHSGLFQCLGNNDLRAVRRMILTASGGPFLNVSQELLDRITPEQALAHPTWKMGSKVTVDCSTLINKGLEVIEASYLFGLPPEKIEVVIHPQSLVHSFVEFVDGAMLAEVHKPDMGVSIQYGITYPMRRPIQLEPFDFIKNGRFDFYPPDTGRFPALNLAYQALKEGGSLPCYLNSANEELVGRFLKREISWRAIVEKLEHLIMRHNKLGEISLDSLLEVDREARTEARHI